MWTSSLTVGHLLYKHTPFNEFQICKNNIDYKKNTSTSHCLKFFHLLARSPNLEIFSIYSNKFFHNFHFSESSFTCPGLWASGLVRRLLTVENQYFIYMLPLVKFKSIKLTYTSAIKTQGFQYFSGLQVLHYLQAVLSY